MKISRKNFKRPIVSNLEKLDKLKGKDNRKTAITRKIKIQQQKGGLFESQKTRLQMDIDSSYVKISKLYKLRDFAFRNYRYLKTQLDKISNTILILINPKQSQETTLALTAIKQEKFIIDIITILAKLREHYNDSGIDSNSISKLIDILQRILQSTVPANDLYSQTFQNEILDTITPFLNGLTKFLQISDEIPGSPFSANERKAQEANNIRYLAFTPDPSTLDVLIDNAEKASQKLRLAKFKLEEEEIKGALCLRDDCRKKKAEDLAKLKLDQENFEKTKPKHLSVQEATKIIRDYDRSVSTKYDPKKLLDKAFPIKDESDFIRQATDIIDVVFDKAFSDELKKSNPRNITADMLINSYPSLKRQANSMMTSSGNIEMFANLTKKDYPPFNSTTLLQKNIKSIVEDDLLLPTYHPIYKDMDSIGQVSSQLDSMVESLLQLCQYCKLTSRLVPDMHRYAALSKIIPQFQFFSSEQEENERTQEIQKLIIAKKPAPVLTTNKIFSEDLQRKKGQHYYEFAINFTSTQFLLDLMLTDIDGNFKILYETVKMAYINSKQGEEMEQAEQAIKNLENGTTNPKFKELFDKLYLTGGRSNNNRRRNDAARAATGDISVGRPKPTSKIFGSSSLQDPTSPLPDKL